MKNIQNLAGQILRQRYAVPMVVVAAFLALIVNEVAFYRTSVMVRRGIELTDARIGAARILQLLTDAETGQRGYLLTKQDAFLAPYRSALKELPEPRANLRRFFAFTESDKQTLARRSNAIIDAKLAEMAQTLALEMQGKHVEAIALIGSGAGRDLMESLREIFSQELDQAAQAQALARSSIYDALQFNRIAAALLTLASMAGVIVYLQQLKQRDREQVERAVSLETVVRTRTRELRQLARHLQNVREDERGYLAREIHDELGGLLTAAKLDLARMRSKLNDGPALLERLEHAIELLNQGIAFKRRVIEDLRPSSLEILGVRAAILTLCEDAQRALAIPVTAELDELKLIPPDDLAVYRFVQEAMTNIAKYAEATHVWVKLWGEVDSVGIEVRDDGVGFVRNVALLGRQGLAGMRFRVESLGGSMTIESSPGKGTVLRARLPLAERPVNAAGQGKGPASHGAKLA
ncbi:CHASE3 domain-containing protein [Variovorax sp. RTB1]|uniref:CHASE3 domain-containing protein n=1 Tax=Variovorax sp. RTB1 TaxID=3048631 RepID=UPI002B22371C|nr:CHASE3 domain-containing protein [Variovorax sp. RTB1]MEB0111679.1 CHASE3 domain-containing protein [Variovorax sp. RTB1]